jgi:hypothetical protein
MKRNNSKLKNLKLKDHLSKNYFFLLATTLMLLKLNRNAGRAFSETWPLKLQMELNLLKRDKLRCKL